MAAATLVAAAAPELALVPITSATPRWSLVSTAKDTPSFLFNERTLEHLPLAGVAELSVTEDGRGLVTVNGESWDVRDRARWKEFQTSDGREVVKFLNARQQAFTRTGGAKEALKVRGLEGPAHQATKARCPRYQVAHLHRHTHTHT